MIRFGVEFIFKIPTSLLVWVDVLSIIYKEAFSGGSLVWYWYVQVVKCLLWIVNECLIYHKLHEGGHMDDKLISKGSLKNYTCVNLIENFSKKVHINWVSTLDGWHN